MQTVRTPNNSSRHPPPARGRCLDGTACSTSRAVQSTAAIRGHLGPAEGDLIFTTAATGWGEILPIHPTRARSSFSRHPMAGNYRVAESELESARPAPRSSARASSRLPTAQDDRSRTCSSRRAFRRSPARHPCADPPAAPRVARRAVTHPGPDQRRGGGCGGRRRDSVGGRRPRTGAATRDPTRSHLVGPAPRGRRWRLRRKRSLLAALAGRGLEVTVRRRMREADVLAGGLRTSSSSSPGPGDPARMARQIAVTCALARAGADADLQHLPRPPAPGTRCRRRDAPA